jgi:hypothetical protein
MDPAELVLRRGGRGELHFAKIALGRLWSILELFMVFRPQRLCQKSNFLFASVPCASVVRSQNSKFQVIEGKMLNNDTCLADNCSPGKP